MENGEKVGKKRVEQGEVTAVKKGFLVVQWNSLSFGAKQIYEVSHREDIQPSGA